MKKFTYLLFIFFTSFFVCLVVSAKEKLYQYRIEYYYDNILEEKATTYKDGTYASLIMDYETRNKDGYAFSHSSIDDGGMTITDDEKANVIKVFYEKKEDTAKVSTEEETEKDTDSILQLKRKIKGIFDFFKDFFSF